jgi:hypothetical protein
MMWVNLTRQKSGAIGKKLKRKSHACNIWTLIDTYIYIYIHASGLHENYGAT